MIVRGLGVEEAGEPRHMIALYGLVQLVKMHKALRTTPALAADVTDKLWSMGGLVALVDAHDAAKPRQKPGR